MEEKERYEVISPSLNGYAYIHDFNTDNVLNTYDSCDLLNQQDKRIKELEQETYPAYKREHQRRAYLENIEIPKLNEENQQLKQQIHDLPNHILGEIKQQLFNHFKVKNIEEYEKLSLIDALFTADTVIEILDTILKSMEGKKMEKAICNECGRLVEIEDGEEWGYCPFCENDQVELNKEPKEMLGNEKRR